MKRNFAWMGLLLMGMAAQLGCRDTGSDRPSEAEAVGPESRGVAQAGGNVTDNPATGEGVQGTQAGVPTTTSGTLSVSGATAELRHAVAYRSRFFGDPAAIVLITDRPLKDEELARLPEATAKGDSLHVSTARLEITLNEDGQALSLFLWVDDKGHSIGGTWGQQIDIQQVGDGYAGRCVIAHGESRAEVEFAAPLIESSDSEPESDIEDSGLTCAQQVNEI